MILCNTQHLSFGFSFFPTFAMVIIFSIVLLLILVILVIYIYLVINYIDIFIITFNFKLMSCKGFLTIQFVLDLILLKKDESDPTEIGSTSLL